MGFLSKIFGKKDAAFEDASRIYTKLMSQARRVEFYGENSAPDNYDGRIDVLTLHIAALLSALNKFGQPGERLGQALFDEMKDDFEIALREEGISDTGVKKRIKPMIALFYTRVKIYAEALHGNNPAEGLRAAFGSTLPDESDGFETVLADYLGRFHQNLAPLSLGQIALTEFSFPEVGKQR